MKRNFWLFLSWLAMGAFLAPIAAAAEPAKSSKIDDKEKVEAVDMFQAIDEGKIEVNFIPKDATQATVVFKNKTDKALDLRLPDAFGAVHVHGQLGGMGGMGGMGGGMGGMGGGMGGMGGGMGGMGGGMFRVEADKTRKAKVPCVCLEHGKKDPNPRMKYKIVPIEQINNDPRVSKLCELLGKGRVAQNTLQAAAWHIANGLSWEELAHKNRVESKYTGNVRFFNPVELRSAFQLSSVIQHEYDKYQESLGSSYGDRDTDDS